MRKTAGVKLLPWRANAAHYLTGGFVLLILAGAALLNLPAASAFGESIGFIDALFTATSAACVTGQAVVPTALQWSWLGRIVIIILIQIGGIGVITLVTLAMKLLRMDITMRERMTIQAAFGQDGVAGMERLIVGVLKTTLCVELAGVALLTVGFYTAREIDLSLGEAAAQGVFHAISAFCNAGFDIVGESGMMPYVENPLINITLMLLIIGGGIGFPVWVEAAGQIRKVIAERLPPGNLWRRLSIHAKVVLSVTAALVFGGGLLFLLLEWDNPKTLEPLTPSGKVLASLFQSVTLRTAGFTTIDQAGMNGSSQFFSCLLMIIGGSPAGTAGGIKTVTFGILAFSVFGAVRGREDITAFRRRFTLRSLQKSLTMAAMLFFVVFTGSVLLRFTEHANPFPHTFLDLLYECSSVSATVGVTTGITPHLSAAGKAVLIISMFIGRLGPTTVAMALTFAHKKGATENEMSAPEANVIIG